MSGQTTLAGGRANGVRAPAPPLARPDTRGDPRLAAAAELLLSPTAERIRRLRRTRQAYRDLADACAARGLAAEVLAVELAGYYGAGADALAKAAERGLHPQLGALLRGYWRQIGERELDVELLLRAEVRRKDTGD